MRRVWSAVAGKVVWEANHQHTPVRANTDCRHILGDLFAWPYISIEATADDVRQSSIGGKLNVDVWVLVQERLSSTSPLSCNCVVKALTCSELTYKKPLYYRPFKIVLNTVSPYIITRDLCIITIHYNIFFWLVRKIGRYFFFRRI